MIPIAPATLACPICGRALDPAIARLNQQLDARMLRLIKTLHPGWTVTAGICPDCVQRAVMVMRERRAAASLHAGLDVSYPVYAADEAELLPTPVRLRANPDFAGRGVTIAFLDSGFYPHADLTTPRDRIRCYVDATHTEPVARAHIRRAEASSWHGLMTSGVAAGNGTSSDGRYHGLAAEADLVLVKTGNRRTHRIPDRDILRALQWVVEHRAEFDIRVVNISLGGDFASTGEATPLDILVEEAVAEGLVVVAAAGNGGNNLIIPPASAHSAITVGGLDDQNSLDDHIFIACGARALAAGWAASPSRTSSRPPSGWRRLFCRTPGYTMRPCSCGGWLELPDRELVALSRVRIWRRPASRKRRCAARCPKFGP